MVKHSVVHHSSVPSSSLPAATDAAGRSAGARRVPDHAEQRKNEAVAGAIARHRQAEKRRWKLLLSRRRTVARCENTTKSCTATVSTALGLYRRKQPKHSRQLARQNGQVGRFPDDSCSLAHLLMHSSCICFLHFLHVTNGFKFSASKHDPHSAAATKQ